MPDRDLIHSLSDVASTLSYALDCGFQVVLDEEQSEPGPRILTRGEIAQIGEGIFYLIRPEWIYGPFQFRQISAGFYRGKYSLSPRVNFTSVSLYFQGERVDQGKRRYGSGCLSCHNDWLEMPAKVIKPAPPEVREWFKKFFAHLSAGVAIKAGVHRYHVTRGVMADPSREECLPPFDFIPWGSEVLKRHGTKKPRQ